MARRMPTSRWPQRRPNRPRREDTCVGECQMKAFLVFGKVDGGPLSSSSWVQRRDGQGERLRGGCFGERLLLGGSRDRSGETEREIRVSVIAEVRGARGETRGRECGYNVRVSHASVLVRVSYSLMELAAPGTPTPPTPRDPPPYCSCSRLTLPHSLVSLTHRHININLRCSRDTPTTLGRSPAVLLIPCTS